MKWNHISLFKAVLQINVYHFFNSQNADNDDNDKNNEINEK